MPSFEKFENLQDVHLVHTNDSASSSSRSAAEKLVGTVIEQRYQLLSLIGEGGMGFVFKAKQLTTGRMVAIKMIASPDISDEQLMRFCQEAKAACAFSHPNAVAIYELFVSEGVTPYLAMQYVEGVTLSEEIEQNGPLTEQDATRVFSQVADALAHAHQSHVLHRDIKPSNIMLVKDLRGNRSAMLLDFGIAKLGSLDEKSLNLTKTGEVFGTPHYMSPEQCQGGEADQRSDIYALGCVMYETLTGEKPVVGENFLQLLSNQVHGKIKSLSEHEAGKAISSRMKKIIHKAIEKDPNKRFQTMSELWQVLSGNVEMPTSRSVVAGPAKRQPWWQIAPKILCATAVAACALALIAYLVGPHIASTEPTPPQATTAAVTHSAVPVPQVMPGNWADKFVDAVRQFRQNKPAEAVRVFRETIDTLKSIDGRELPRSGPYGTDEICQKLTHKLSDDASSNGFWCLATAFQESQGRANLIANLIPNVAMTKAAVLAFNEGFARYPNDGGINHDQGSAYECLAGDERWVGGEENLLKAIKDYKLAVQIEEAYIKREKQQGGNPVDIYNRIANVYHLIGEIEDSRSDPASAREAYGTAEAWYKQADELIVKTDQDWAFDGAFLRQDAENEASLKHSSEAAVLNKQAEEHEKSFAKRRPEDYRRLYAEKHPGIEVTKHGV